MKTRAIRLGGPSIIATLALVGCTAVAPQMTESSDTNDFKYEDGIRAAAGVEPSITATKQ